MMWSRGGVALLMVLLCGAPACGADDAGGPGDGGGGGGEGGGGGGGEGVDAGPGEGSEGDPIPACWLGCESPADCNLGTALSDADNYSCEEGRCIYQGCNSTAECAEALQSADYACGTVAGLDIPACHKICGAAADCALPSAAFDEDNYRCPDGLCEYTGCNGDAECAASFGDAYGCRTEGLAVPACSLRCAGPSDCAIAGGGALHDADNYECAEDGYCRWVGCNGTAECTSTFMDARYVCE